MFDLLENGKILITDITLSGTTKKLLPSFHDVYNDIYLKRYVTALFKKQWGANLSKFDGVAMIGGVTLNGRQIYSEALQDIEKLETEIRSTFELNPAMMIG